MISGSFVHSKNGDKDLNTLSQTFGIHEELHHIMESTNMDITLAKSTRRIPLRPRGC
jgi:hypothetical protein